MLEALTKEKKRIPAYRQQGRSLTAYNATQPRTPRHLKNVKWSSGGPKTADWIRKKVQPHVIGPSNQMISFLIRALPV